VHTRRLGILAILAPAAALTLSLCASRSDAAEMLGVVVTPPGHPRALIEDCDNCVDDDGDDFVDRLDADCDAPAFGGGQGLQDPTGAGKALVKCQKGLQKAGVAFVTKKLGRMSKCLGAVASCIQLGKPGCDVKATATCTKQLDGIGDDEAKVRGAVAKACGGVPAPLSPSQLQDAIGLGFGAEAGDCAARGVPTLENAEDIGNCVVAQHECRIEEIAGAIVPRAREYLGFVGVDAATAFPCIPVGANGGESGLTGEPKQKAALKCDAALRKVGLKLAKATFKLSCVDPATKCVQLKPTDPTCLPKASAKCSKTLAKFAGSGTLVKLLETVVKGCTSGDLTLQDVLDPVGLGFERRCALQRARYADHLLRYALRVRRRAGTLQHRPDAGAASAARARAARSPQPGATGLNEAVQRSPYFGFRFSTNARIASRPSALRAVMAITSDAWA